MSQAAGKFKSARPERIFDCFVTVELQTQLGKDNVENVVPAISYRYPPQGNMNDKKEKEKDGTMASIPHFCFPVIDKEPKSKMDKEIFSFVLTESDGARRFGYCRRFLPPGKGKRFPQCFCIVSFYPCFSMFSQILDEVELRWFSTGKSVITPLLEAILGSKFPLPGQSFEFPVVSYKQAGVIETLRFTRPNDDESTLDYVNFTPLLQLLSPENILSTFASLLIERRVIFVSERLSTLSNCVQACVALLYPFTWQHVYIPVLPTSLLTMCCAPMPFVVGILSSSLAEVLSLPLDEVLVVDIDHNKFLLSPGNDIELLPAPDLTLLFAMLRSSAKLVKKTALEGLLNRDETHLSKKDAMALTKEFAGFFANLLSEYPRFVNSGANGEFDRDGFVKASAPEATPLLQWMLQGQMFERWIEEKRAGGATGGEFELHLSLRRSSGRSATEDPKAADDKAALSRLLRQQGGSGGQDGDRVDVVKKGHLYKLGRFKRWEKKWFVLDIKFLTSYATFETPTPSERLALVDIARIYKADQASGEQSKPDGTMIIVELKPPSATAPPNVTRVQFFLRADTVDETHNWLTVLTTWLDSTRHQLDVSQVGTLTHSQPHPTGAPPRPHPNNMSDSRINLPARKQTTEPASAPSVDASQPSSFFALPPHIVPNRPVPPPPKPAAASANAASVATAPATVAPAAISPRSPPHAAPAVPPPTAHSPSSPPPTAAVPPVPRRELPPALPVDSTRKLPRAGLRPTSNMSLQSSSLTHAMIDYPSRQSDLTAALEQPSMEVKRRETSADLPRLAPTVPSRPSAIPRAATHVPSTHGGSGSPVAVSALSHTQHSSSPQLQQAAPHQPAPLPRARPGSVKNFPPMHAPPRAEASPLRPLPQPQPRTAAKP